MMIFDAANKHSGVANTAHKETPSVQTREVEQTQLREKVKDNSEIKNSQTKREISQKLNQAVENLNHQMESLKTDISFGYNDKINSMYVDVKESKTGKIIRKIPCEEVIKLTEYFREAIGLIFNKKG